MAFRIQNLDIRLAYQVLSRYLSNRRTTQKQAANDAELGQKVFEKNAIPSPSNMFDTKEKKRVVFCAGMYFYAVMSSYSLIAPFFPQEAFAKGIERVYVGSMFSVFRLTVFIGRRILNRLIPKLNLKYLYVFGLLIEASSLMSFGFLEDAPGGYKFVIIAFSLRIGMGIGQACASSGALCLLSNIYGEGICPAVVFVEVLGAMGFILGPPLGGIIISRLSFKIPFILFSSILFSNAILSSFILKNPEDSDGLCHNERVLGKTFPIQTEKDDKDSNDNNEKENKKTDDKSIKDDANELNKDKDMEDNEVLKNRMATKRRKPRDPTWRNAIRVPSIILMMFAIIVGGLSLSFLDAILSRRLKESHLSHGEIGAFFLIMPFIYAIMGPVTGFIGSRMNTRILMTIGCMMCGGAYLLMGPAPILEGHLQKSLILFSGSLALLGFSVAPFLVPVLADMIKSGLISGMPDNAESYELFSEVFNYMFMIGAIIGPIVGGLLTDKFGFEIATGGLSAFLGGMTVILLMFTIVEKRLHRRRRLRGGVSIYRPGAPNHISLPTAA